MSNCTRRLTRHPFAHSPSPCPNPLIHAFRLTSAAPPPVDNANAATHTGPDAWMALRAIGGGW